MRFRSMGRLPRSDRQRHERRCGEWLSRLATAAVIAALVSVSSEARAAVILAGNSNSSSFANCSGSCVVLTTTSVRLSTWTLNINPVSFSETADAFAVPLATLQMNTGGNNPGSVAASFDYNLVLTFTTPIGGFSDPLNLHEWVGQRGKFYRDIV
jgi:hypothetical protein